uniref:IstB-like ATP binding protein n=1 Tax=Candidatus Kentrum sp. MB TaxID=2138164 RepID=A0A450XFQ5_9GAMM|nr:MAG: IstB-like ATP binding protein [Candidatus Kentron sp. MB]
MAQLTKFQRLILDDWDMRKITAPQQADLMERIEARHGLRFMLIASQLPIDSWHEYIGEATLADVILRLLHNAHRLPLLNPCAGYYQKPYLILRIQIRKKGRRKKRKKLTMVTNFAQPAIVQRVWRMDSGTPAP